MKQFSRGKRFSRENRVRLDADDLKDMETVKKALGNSENQGRHYWEVWAEQAIAEGQEYLSRHGLTAEQVEKDHKENMRADPDKHGADYDSLPVLAARLIQYGGHVLASGKDGGNKTVAMTSMFVLGRTVALWEVYSITSNASKAGGNTSKRRGWADMAADHLKKEYPSLTKQQKWESIPEHDKPLEFEDEGRYGIIDIYREGDSLYAEVGHGEQPDPIKKSTFLKRYLKKEDTCAR